MKIKILTSLIFLLLITASASAQPNQLKFNLVEGPNGRPLGKVNAISQDPNGYIWLAGQSEKCLYRYDGNRWTIYRHDPSNPNSLGLLYIETAYADSKGYIWIGGDGLDQFNPRTGTFKHFKKSENDPASLAANYVNAIFEDSKGRIWIGTEGLDRYDEKTESFIHYKHDPADPGSLSDKVVRSIYEDRKGVIWVGTGEPFFNQDPDKGGLNRLEEDGTFTRFVHDPKDPNSLANNKVRAIFEDSRGVFWIGTSKEIGLHTMDRETGKFQRYPYNPDNPGQLSRPLLKTAQQDKFAHDNDQVTFIIEDTAGEIWISSMWSGINRYNPFTKKMTHYDSTLGFPDRSGWNAFLSRDGVLWISTEQGNLYRVEPFRKTVSTTITGTERVRDFLEESDGSLWLGTQGNGLLLYDQNKQLIRQYKHTSSDPKSISNDHVHCFFRDGQDNFWLGTEEGIEIFDKSTQEFSRLPVDQSLKDSVRAPVFQIMQDTKGSHWFTSFGKGLFRYNARDNSVKRYVPDKMDSTTIGSRYVIDVLEDRLGEIWVSTLNGVAKFDRESDCFRHYLRDIKFMPLFEDATGTLWLGAGDKGRGLYRYDRTEDKFVPAFDPLSELNYERVYEIAEDDLNNLWLNTGSKLVRLDKATNQTFFYGSKYVVGISYSTQFGGLYKTRSGEILAGNDRGFYSFLPGELAVESEIKLNITDVFINNVRLVTGKEGLIKTPVEQVKELVLSHDQNNLTFDFAAVDYSAPEAIKYYTMLENYDDTWREAQRENSGFYLVPPGSYIFRVKAYMSDGIIVEKSISLRIDPPWWLTWWAYSVYGFCGLALLYIGRREVVRRERLHATFQLEHLELEKAKEVDKVRSSLFANISHEFRTPLTLIKGHASDLLEEYARYPKIKERLKLIDSNADLLLKLINQLLDLAKLDAGNFKVSKSEFDLNFCLRAMTSSFSSMAAQKNIELITHFPTVQYVAVLDNDKLETILINLLNNAIKFTPRGGKVEVRASIEFVDQQGLRDGAVLTIDVKDSGIGIHQDQHSKIFERFYQVSETHKEIGTGIGLALVKELVELLQGSINVKSEPGKGSEFTLRLPLQITRELGEAELLNQVELPIVTMHNGDIKNIEPNGIHEKPKLLVVEDNADLIKFIISSLGADYEFLEASDGKQGLEIALKEMPEIIISDVMMPEMDGIQMTNRIKKDLRTCHIPVIILTAKASDKNKIEGLNTGAYDYLTKPFNKNELVLKVKNAIAAQKQIRNKIKLELLREGPKVEVVSEDEKFLAKVKETILRRLSDERLSVETLVEEVGMSRAQFYRKITALTGMTANDLIRNFRLQKAAQLLAQHWGSISQVAYEVGFSNPSYFSKTFKEEFGVLPSEYSSQHHVN